MTPLARVTAILVAAGASRRMGFDKVLAELAGKSVLQHSLEAFERAASIDAIVIVGSPAVLETARPWLDAACSGKLVAVVPGGSERQHSVHNGLLAAPVGTTHAAVHDAARPLVCPAAIDRTVEAALEHGAAVLAHPIPDTVKRVDAQGLVAASVDRNGLWAMETPQVARLDWLVTAMTNAACNEQSVTDEVSALQLAGYPVHTVRNPTGNPKITWPEDIAQAESLLRG